MLHKAPRRTHKRFFTLSLRRLIESNEFGQPSITSPAIADDMAVSPGNRHGHLRIRDDIGNPMFVYFNAEIEHALTMSDTPLPGAADARPCLRGDSGARFEKLPQQYREKTHLEGDRHGMDRIPAHG